MNPLISIIIPFFGTADPQLLQRCLDSIHQQGLEENQYEVLVMDDDGKGVYFARNKAIGQAKGSYLYFVDADDYLFPDTLLPCVRLLLEQSPDMLSFQFRRVEAEKKVSIQQSTLTVTPYETGSHYMLQQNFIGAIWHFMVRREVLIKNQLLFSLRKHHQDEGFTAMAYFYSKKVVVTSLVVYAYCKQANSLVTHKGKQQQEERISDFYYMLNCLNTIQKKQEAASIGGRALKRRISFLTIDYLRQLRRNGCNIQDVHYQLKQLKKEGMLPLPKVAYSWKYSIVQILLNTYIKLFVRSGL